MWRPYKSVQLHHTSSERSKLEVLKVLNVLEDFEDFQNDLLGTKTLIRL
jgi:hypothetical protein